MKLLMIIIDETKKEELEVFLGHTGVQGLTEIPHAVGMGLSGRRLGSGAFPRTSALIFSVVDDETVEAVRRGVEEFCRDCGEKLRMVAWEVEELF